MKALKVGFCGAMFAACVAAPLQAQTRAVSTLQSGLAMAQCPGPVPCNTAGITFERGSVRLKKVKEPDPIFSTFIGTISLQGVLPPQTNLDAVVSARVSYGPDPTGNCPVANTQAVLNPWATSSLTCTSSGFGFLTNCRGDLNLAALVPLQCSDVDMIFEDVRTQVYEAGLVGTTAGLIARDGHSATGGSPDCNSGGSGGCP
jgi:hypothetical protein